MVTQPVFHSAGSATHILKFACAPTNYIYYILGVTVYEMFDGKAFLAGIGVDMLSTFD